MDPPPHIPMPPPGRNDAPTPNASAPVVGARQNCPAAERQGIILTPPRAVELRRGTVGSERSAMSSLRTTTTDQLSTECAHAATALTDTTPLSGNKHPASVLHPDSSPSPSKNYSDYSITKSSGDSVASGNDSIQWEAEGERILAEHARKTQEEDDKFEAEAQAELNHAAIDEFMLCGEEINKINNDEEGGADVPVAPPIFEMVRYPYKPTTIASLRLVASALKIAASGTKKTLWDRICKCGNADITVEDETTDGIFAVECD